MDTRKLLTMPKSKKGIGAIGPIVNAIIYLILGLLVVAAIMVGVVAFGNTQSAGSSARNLTNNIGALTNNFGAQLGVVGTILAVVIILAAITFVTLFLGGFGVGGGREK